MKNLLLIVILTLVPVPAHAQHVNLGVLDDTTQVATVTTGAEHGLVLGLGYARVQPVAGRPIVVGGDLSLGWAEIDLSDFRLRAGALAPIVGGRSWKVIGGLTTTVRGTENDIARMTNVGVDVAVLAGRYARRGFVAAELGFDWAMATHVAHGDAYRMTVYSDARDGWYGNPGGVLRAGLQGGVSLGRFDLVLRAGRLTDATGAPAKLPFYGTLSFATRW